MCTWFTSARLSSDLVAGWLHTCRWRRFILRHRAQVLEVLTKYGEICEASFDMDFPAIADEDMEDTFMLARQLAPNTLFRGRGMLLQPASPNLNLVSGRLLWSICQIASSKLGPIFFWYSSAD